MNIERALEIVAAFGGDARRWPDDERGDVLALAAVDAGLAAAIAEARGMDALLSDWARDVAPVDFDAAAIVRDAAVVVPVSKPVTRPGRRWFAGSALAAAVAAGVLVLAPLGPAPEVETVSVDSPVQSATAEGGALGSDAEAFAYVFTPTLDEDELI